MYIYVPTCQDGRSRPIFAYSRSLLSCFLVYMILLDLAMSLCDALQRRANICIYTHVLKYVP